MGDTVKRVAVCVDAGYLFAQGSVLLAGTKQRRELLVLEPETIFAELRQFAALKAHGTPLLRIYWYDGAIGLQPTLEQEQLAHCDDVKVRLGFINSHGQQKGVDSLIVTDLIELARLGAISDAVLLSGDEDVRIGVQIAQSYGVRVHVLGIEPSRGSQSKPLLQEADTTSEWKRETVAKFLAIRSVAAASPSTVAAAISTLDTKPAAPDAPGQPEPEHVSRLKTVAEGFAASLTVGDTMGLIGYWASQKGVPPEFDGRLLAKGRAEVGRDLNVTEKRLIRTWFQDAVGALAKTS
ncbi:MAG: NYN domain-containing protein [Rhodopseudomonas palustris]|nr:MAG: NYN domain-containing protein [Rhodopseudomonas palustris]